jgi:hypothetical protein
MRLVVARLIALILVGEALLAIVFAYIYGTYFFYDSLTFVERSLIVGLFLATATCCFLAALVLFNGWHLAAHVHVWWRVILLLAAGFNLGALAFDLRELARGGWSSSETLGFYAEFAALLAMVGSLVLLASRPKMQSPS